MPTRRPATSTRGSLHATLRDAAGAVADGGAARGRSRRTSSSGTVTICPPGSPFAEVGREGESEFRFLAVAPDAWRTGVGRGARRRLRAAGPAMAAADRAGHLRRSTATRRAHRLYRRLGFERLPERDWEPRPGIDLLAYRRDGAVPPRDRVPHRRAVQSRMAMMSPSRTTSPGVTLISVTVPVDLGEHGDLHLHRLQDDQGVADGDRRCRPRRRRSGPRPPSPLERSAPRVLLLPDPVRPVRDGNLPDARDDLHPERLGGLLARARSVHQGLDRLLESVLAQARAALVEVLRDAGHGSVSSISPSRNAVDEGEHLGAVLLVRVAAAHEPVTSFDADRGRDESALDRVVLQQLAQQLATAVQPGHHGADAACP